MGSAQSHLEKNSVGIGDLFLFFGLFRKTIIDNGSLTFDPASKPVHLIYGYLQIGAVHRVSDLKKVPVWMKYHPHFNKAIKHQNNTIYQATDRLTFDEKLSGAGILKYHPSLVLTKPGQTPSQWSLPNCFKNINITYHTGTKNYGWHKDYFQSALRGQEFIIEENDDVSQWATNLILENKPT